MEGGYQLSFYDAVEIQMLCLFPGYVFSQVSLLAVKGTGGGSDTSHVRLIL